MQLLIRLVFLMHDIRGPSNTSSHHAPERHCTNCLKPFESILRRLAETSAFHVMADVVPWSMDSLPASLRWCAAYASSRPVDKKCAVSLAKFLHSRNTSRTSELGKIKYHWSGKLRVHWTQVLNSFQEITLLNSLERIKKSKWQSMPVISAVFISRFMVQIRCFGRLCYCSN